MPDSTTSIASSTPPPLVGPSVELQKKLARALASPTKPSNPLLHWPIIVESLAEGASLTAPIEPGELDHSPLHIAADSANMTLWQTLWNEVGPFDIELPEPHEGLSLALCAAESGNTAALSFLLSHRARPDARALDGQGLLLLASASGSKACFNLALEQVPDQCFDVGPTGMSVFDQCVLSNQGDAVSYLIEKGVSAEHPIGHVRALLAACSIGAASSIRALVHHGANPNWVDKDPASPLSMALHATTDSAAAAMTLIDVGADPSLPAAGPGSTSHLDPIFTQKLQGPNHHYWVGMQSMMEDFAPVASMETSRREALIEKMNERLKPRGSRRSR